MKFYIQIQLWGIGILKEEGLFFENENFSLSAGCNTLFGEVNIESSTLCFSMIASTFIGCSGPEGIREKEFKLS